ncbi:protein transport protein Sec24A-like [Tachypleus tridentatus]|uniref:protein transport protein Sec24A-like n=1 Tax=Tachypleus tridentatus TaxID=6853 RepID=UPI003FD1E13A
MSAGLPGQHTTGSVGRPPVSSVHVSYTNISPGSTFHSTAVSYTTNTESCADNKQPQILPFQESNAVDNLLGPSSGMSSTTAGYPVPQSQFKPSQYASPSLVLQQQNNYQAPKVSVPGNSNAPIHSVQNGPRLTPQFPQTSQMMYRTGQHPVGRMPGPHQMQPIQGVFPRESLPQRGSYPRYLGQNTSVPLPGIPSSSSPLLPAPFPVQSWAQSSCPGVTPGPSAPASARSSQNTSPIPMQHIDYMEGQFPSSRPNPVTSATNLQALSHRSGEPRFNGPPIVQGSCPPPPPSVQSAAPFISTTSSVISQPTQAQNWSFGPPRGGVRPAHVRPRYPQQSESSQTSYLTSQSVRQPSPLVTTSGPTQQHFSLKHPEGPVGGIVGGYDPQLHAQMTGMSIHGGFSKMWGCENVNLLQDKNILPSVPLEPQKIVTPHDRPACNPDIFRCTLKKIPETHSLLHKSRLPLGILIHPFRDLNHLPVIQCGCIVRCRSCRTYINPYVSFVDQRRWKCNLCFRINDLPEEFLYDPVSGSYGDPSKRPEIRNATVEFIAPSEYMLRPPQPAVYLYVLDVSHSALQTGYLTVFCKIMLEELDNFPGDSRTQIGFITFDGSIHFYNLNETLNQPSMLVMSDIDDVFLPLPEGLLVNLHENRTLIQDLLKDLPNRFAENDDTNTALGAALQAAYKLMAPTGGRITVIQTHLPNVGPGSLKPREDPNQRAARDVSNLGPATDFYKQLALDCSIQQIAVDLFLLSSQYSDLATLACMSKFSAGSVNYYPSFHATMNKLMTEKYQKDLRRYLTRKIGFEAVMRIRCARGLSLHTFHGNFFVRSRDLLSLPNVNPDAGYGMQVAIEENLTDYRNVCFQAAVLYTSSKGERRIRVHTLSLPVVAVVTEVLGNADQESIICLLAKMAVDKSIASLSDAQDAMINSCCDLISTYHNTLAAGQTAGALMVPYCARLLPLFVLGLLKSVAFRVGISTKLDERVFAMEQMKSMPLSYLMTFIYPRMYPVHALDDNKSLQTDERKTVPQPPILQLTLEKIDPTGAYLLDTVGLMYLYVGRGISDHFCSGVLGISTFRAIPEGMTELPELDTPESVRLRNFISWLLSQRPFHTPLLILREDSKEKYRFLQHMVDDRSESSFSYYEFLQHLKQQVSK